MSIEIVPVPGAGGYQRGDPPWYRRFGVSVWQTWSDWFRPGGVNWSTFTLIAVTGEIEWHMGTAEVVLGLLNVTVRFTYYWPNENREDLKRTVRLVEAGLLETEPIDLDTP